MKPQSALYTSGRMIIGCLLSLLIPLFSALARPSQPTIVYTSHRVGDNWDVFTMDASGRNVVQLTHTPLPDLYPDWSPDGTKIAFRSGTDLVVIDCDGSNWKEIPIEGASRPTDMDWSPDGNQIVFSSPEVGDDIFIVDVTAGVVRNLTNHPRVDAHPSWSPDGQWIVFESNRDPQFWQGGNLTSDLYIMDAEGKNLRNLTQTMSHESSPAWSPDGTEIAFVMSSNEFGKQVYVMDVNGVTPRRLTDFKGSVAIFSPAWTPDSQQIVFSAYRADKGRNGGEDIYVIHRDGTNLHPITDNLDGIGGARHPDWFGSSLGVSPVGLKSIMWGAIKQTRQ